MHEKIAARLVLGGFRSAAERFTAITARARTRFERRDWSGMMADMGSRLELHSAEVDGLILRLERGLGEAARDPRTWAAAKLLYAERLADSRNRELAETFFNSVSRRLLRIVGKNPETEFDSEAWAVDRRDENPRVFERHPWTEPTSGVIRRILEGLRLAARWEDLPADAARVAEEIEGYVGGILGRQAIEQLEVLRPVFFRQKLAFVIGRIRAGRSVLPLMLALRHGSGGIAVDAVLLRQTELSIVFSFTRSHFHVETDCPRELIVFLKGIMPLKPVAELYISLGLFKHGKTELYRSLRAHLRSTIDRFEPARGEPGMVMLVFTLPFYNMVFKIIRDRFAYPKTTTRREVIERYRLVFTRDRVGRLVEAQVFEGLEFRAEQFRPELLGELLREAGSTVSLRDGAVVLEHVYVERKVVPLNLYLREASAPEALEAVRDYGEAVKDLAAANIFPGDFLLKNFGVTRNRRVVFYDYDELCLMSDCRFRTMPPTRYPEDELADEPWFSVGENDVFPEEFERFLGLDGPLKECFLRHHRELFDAGFWSDLQRRLRAGEIMDVFPYPPAMRLRRGAAG